MNRPDWNPGSLLKVSGAYWQTCTLHTGVKLEIFTRIGTGRLTGNEMATQLGMDFRGVRVLLNALSAMNLLTQSGDAYANTRESGLYLSKSSDQYIGHMILHHHHLADSWIHMDKALEQGGPIRNAGKSPDPVVRESFLMGMFNIAMATAPGLAGELDLSHCRTLLDLGGGPGTYAIQFCLANPDLRAVVCDLPTTRPFAEMTIQRFKAGSRVSFKEGDYTDPGFSLDTAFDAAWLSHILHGEGPDMAEQVVKKAADALNPEGRLFIHEFILDNTGDGPEFPALFSMNMFLGTNQGRAYTEAELIQMMKSAGIREIKRLDFKGPTQSGILTGVVS